MVLDVPNAIRGAAHRDAFGQIQIKTAGHGEVSALLEPAVEHAA